jgi:hypothetical protein
MEATPMKLLTVFSTTVLAVLLGISAPVFAQDEPHPQEEKRTAPDDKAAQPEKQEDKQVDKGKEKKAVVFPKTVFGLTLAGSTLFKLAGRSSSPELLASSMAAIGL